MLDLVMLAQWLGTVGVSGFYPLQNWRLFFTRNPVGLSFLAFAFITVGVAGYLTLGIQLGLLGLIVGNAINLGFALPILAIILLRSKTLTARERSRGLLVLGTAFVAFAWLLLLGGAVLETAAGWIGLAGVLAFYPIQNASLFRSKDPTGLSLVAFASLAVGLAGYTMLGVLVGDITIILGNGLTFIGTLPILFMIVRYRKRSP